MLNDSPAIGPAKTFWVYGGFSLLGLILVLALLPETKGKTLEEIEASWLHS
jgi:SP family arabinose:H+ symporter-like MFS transporter